MPITDQDARELARRILTTAGAASSMPPLTDGMPAFDLDDAYRVAARVMEGRIAEGARPVGWKIGFTNRTIWDEYGVHAPIWGPMYDDTVQTVSSAGRPSTVSRSASSSSHGSSPRSSCGSPGRPIRIWTSDELLACIDGVGHGCEIVQSLFPDWRFRAADTVAAFALHGRYLHGPLTTIGPDGREDWLSGLSAFEMVLSCNDREIDRGSAANVLGGPLSAVRHFVRGLSGCPLPIGLRAGDLVTTGTVTRAFPVQPGERWSTQVVGLPLPGMHLLFT
jgi:2-oxo-3-hexenedioate decarboxylase